MRIYKVVLRSVKNLLKVIKSSFNILDFNQKYLKYVDISDIKRILGNFYFKVIGFHSKPDLTELLTNRISKRGKKAILNSCGNTNRRTKKTPEM